MRVAIRIGRRLAFDEEVEVPRLFSIRPVLVLRGRKFNRLRGFAGKPFHPPLTDFPVGTLVGYGAIYGGALVYEYGFNVETAGDHPVWHRSESDVTSGGHQPA